MRRLFLVTLVVASLSASCASFPANTGETGLLILKNDSEYKTMDAYNAYYRLYYSPDKYIKLLPSGSIKFINKLAPGEYTCFRLDSVYAKSEKVANTNTVYCRFEIEEGKYTIFPYVLKTHFTTGAIGKLQYYRLDEMDADMMDAVNAELRELPKFDQWEEKKR